jgi:hypothetical protein
MQQADTLARLPLQERNGFLEVEADLLHLPKSGVGHETFENDLLRQEDDEEEDEEEDEDEEEVEEKDEEGCFRDDDTISLIAGDLEGN